MAYSEVIKEAFATARSNDPIFETIEIRHASIPQSIFIVKNTEDMEFPLELGGELVPFRAAGLDITLPTRSQEGTQDLAITISNVGKEASDFLQKAATFPEEPVILVYRPYLKSDLSRPHMEPPLELSLAGATISSLEVSGTASLTDMLNKRFLTEIYDEERFPAL